MKHRSGCVLIIASSGRMLAEGARKAGLQALVIDLYADLDTRQQALDVYAVPSLALPQVAPVLDDLIERYRVGRVIYGSGLEYHPETLDYLDARMTVLGNAPVVFRQLQRKSDFFSTLAALQIPFPEVSFTAPDVERDGLIKPMQGQGGMGICRYNGNRQIPKNAYWQRFQSGTPGSVLFLANTQEARVIGFNTQFTVKLAAGLEFVFSGLINHANLSDGQKSLISGWVSRCAQAFALKGLNSLDFIHDGEHVYVLEINPRPSASMQLYDDVLALHIAACRGGLPEVMPAQTGFAGFQIIYADKDLRIPADFDWPEGTRDRPAAGVLCRAGQPVCSITVRRSDPEQVRAALAAGQQHIFNQLTKV